MKGQLQAKQMYSHGAAESLDFGRTFLCAVVGEGLQLGPHAVEFLCQLGQSSINIDADADASGRRSAVAGRGGH